MIQRNDCLAATGNKWQRKAIMRGCLDFFPVQAWTMDNVIAIDLDPLPSPVVSLSQGSSWINEEGLPVLVGRKEIHHWTFALASLLRWILWCSCLAFVLRMINQHSFDCEASFPMRDISRRFVVVLQVSQLCSSSMRSASLWLGRHSS